MASNQEPSDLEDQYVLRSGVRAGLKREFTFAMRAQSELPSLLGRTRSSQSVKKPKVSELPLSSRPQPLNRVEVPSSPVEVNVPSSKDSLDELGMKSGVEVENKENLAECGAGMAPPVGVVHPAPSHACATTNCRDEAAGGPVAGPQIEARIYTYSRRRSLKIALGKRSEMANMEAVSKPMEEQLQLESPVSSDKPVGRFTQSAFKQDSGETAEEVAASDTVHADVAQQEQVPNRRFTRSVLKDQAEGSRSGAAAGQASSNGVPSRKNNMEIKMSKKISVNKVPGTVRDLLSTGLLEGLAVEYKFPNGRVWAV